MAVEIHHGRKPKGDAGVEVNARSTSRLSRFIAETSYEPIPAEVIHSTKRHILDGIIVTAAACGTPMAKALIRLKAEQGGAPEATLIVDGRKIPAASAAYVHTQLSNLLDADETMLNRMHAVAGSTMTGLAMAERTGATGSDLIAAIAIGFDVTARVGLSLRQYAPDGKGGLVFAPLYGWGWMTFGATATASRLLGLTPYQVAHALGQALITTPANFDQSRNNRRLLSEGPSASWHKSKMGGAMAEAGVTAALLASFGWIAQDDIFDEGSEFWKSFFFVGLRLVYDIRYVGETLVCRREFNQAISVLPLWSRSAGYLFENYRM